MLPGGLHAAVLPMKDDPVHWSALGDALENAVEHEATAHGAGFDHSSFGKVIEAVKSDEIQAWFLLAAWDVCRPKIVGAAVEFPTVLTHWDGQDFQHHHAIYQEDTVLPIGMLRELAKERPAGKFFPPDIGLGEFFEQERIKQRMQGNNPPLGRVGEYSAHNAKIIKIMKQSGVRLGGEADGAVFELDGAVPRNFDRWHVPVRTEGLFHDKNSPIPLPHVFLVNWDSADNKQRIAASFTKGISTFTGKTVVRVQVTSNGNLPSPQALQGVMASILAAGQEEASRREWGAPAYHPRPSPIISIHGTKRELWASAIASNKAELFIPRATFAPIFGHPAPIMRIHALGEPEIITALNAELPRRILGNHPMLATDQRFSQMVGRQALCANLQGRCSDRLLAVG
ncbi:MAG: hypothetical protein KGI37_10530 [Alphaproteobacteria bacterium]|nr:hypothetical protein [Alphaproteobacteria bacterium]